MILQCTEHQIRTISCNTIDYNFFEQRFPVGVSLPGSAVPLFSHQAQVDVPYDASETAKYNPPVGRDSNEAHERDGRPELRTRDVDFHKVLIQISSARVGIQQEQIQSYPLDRGHNLIQALPLQHAHDAYEKGYIDSSANSLVQGKLGKRVLNVQSLPLLNSLLLCHGRGFAAWKPFFKLVLPDVVYRRIEDRVRHEVKNGR